MTIIRRQDQLPVEVFQSEFTSKYDRNLLGTDQIQNVPYIASWEGTYDVVIRQDPTDKDDNKSNRTIAPYLWQMTVTPAKCSASSPSTPFRCGAGGQCRASQADCPASTCTGPASATYCNGGCTTDCNKPTLPTGLIYTDLYATNSSGAAGGAVIATSTCPDGGLRSTTTDCPTRRQCPAGWIMCQTDHYTCVSTAAGAGACPPAPTCPAGWFACPNGRCATRAENCGGDVTCPTGLVLCPDGSCQSNRGACQEILSCDRYPHPVTPAKFQVACAAGTCRGEWADCPVPRACPSGWTLCSNGQCQPSLSQCSAPAVCAPSEHRCGDGTCRQNHLLCPSQATCPIGQVQCSDGECVSDVSFCRIPRPCPSTRPVYCPDGSCASNITACATTKTCPLTSPTLCADGSCATSLSACVSTLACPSHMDVRCPDGTCRSSLESCPTLVRCPPQAPVRCSDGRCAPAPEVCTSPLVLTCPENAPVRCPSGECSASLIQCPTPMTCPASQQRCVDGTCRGSCDVGIIKEALQRCKDPRAPVTCPNSHMGVSCAASLSECPTSRTCPWNLPVRCADQSCAVSIEECPPAINLLSSQFGCAGGSIAGALGACGTSVTCPPQVPVKCWDESCRVVAEDCPPPPRCPRDTKTGSNDDAPFLCSDGSCVSSLGGCKTSGSCPRDLPVKCSWFRTALNPDALTIGDEISDTASCARSIGECINLLGNEQSISDDGKKSLPQNSPNRGATTQATRTRGDCPSGRAVRTHTGACVASTTYTGIKMCPLHAPYQCPGGLCVRGSVRGFPDPNMSPDDISSCPTEDQLREQCPPNQIRCHDGSCAPSKDECIDQYDTYNACPASRPYRCESGFCAISSTRCPIIPEVVTESCPASTPVRCADWSCRELAIQCPVVKPCYIRYNKDGATSVTNLTRCADATCPDPITGQCSSTGITSTTQLNRRCPSGRERCANGLCAIIGSCVDEQLPNSQGCPVTPQGAVTRCSSNGYCSSSATNCPTALKPTNGCINPDHIKCWDGSCAESLSKCERAPNGCPAARPVLCASGDCAATPSSCSAGSSCTNGGVRCPSGVCASSYSACEIRGCPSDKPVRCADGTCKALRAQFSTTGNPFNADTMCIPTVVCPSREPYMCADGSCVASTRLCRPVYECATGFVYCPYTTSCLSTADAKKCPTPDNVRSKDATEPVCPAANPTLCPDGACRRTAAECHDFRLNPRCDIGKVQCWDGTCETSYQACISRGVLLRRGIPTIGSGADKKPVQLVQRGGEQMPLLPYDLLIDETVACPTGAKFVCPDGDCVTDRKLCHAIASCPSTVPQRCWDGSCVNSTVSACPPSPTPTGPACSSGVRCEDGVCRSGNYGSCPLAANCPANDPNRVGSSYYCAGLISSPCVSDRSKCIELLNNAPSVCQDRCERDNIVRVTPVALPAPGTAPRDIQVDVSFDAQNVLRTQVIVPAGAVPGRVVTFQTMRGETPRRRKVPSNNPTPYDREDVELLSTPFTCSVDGRDEPTILTNPWNVYGAIDRKAYALNNGPTGSANGNDAGNTVVPCEYQGEFTALGTSPWSIDNSVNVPQTRGDVSISPNTIVINLDQSLDTLSLSGDLTAFDISPASGFKRWIPNQQQGFICLCFNITSSERIPKPTSIRGYRDYPGYNVEENYKVGSYFCAKMSRTSNPKDSTITLLSYVVQPSGGAQQLTCPTSGQPDIRTLSVTHKPKSVDCGLTATGATSSAGDNGLIRGSNICLASYNAQRGEWSCTESDEVFFWNFQEGLDQAGQERYRGFVLSPSYKELVKYRAWDPSLGLPITRAQGSIKICDPNVPYAFAQFQAPLPSIPPTPECDLWCKYWRVILGVVLGVGIFTCLAAFAIFRLVRYRRKYKEKQEHLRDLKDRAMELDQYHGGLGVDGGDDDDIHMMANPLVIEMQDLELQIRKVEQDMNVQGDTERLQIDQLEMERQRLYAEIQRVKEAMQKQNVTTGAPSRTSVAPAALGGYAGNTTAPLPGQMYTGGQSQQRLVPNQPQSESTIHHEFGQVRRPAKKKDF